MSTVVLTPTHIASDHTVVRQIYPHNAVTDLGYRKIFLPPDKSFVIGTVGDFIPTDIEHPEVLKACETIFKELILQQNVESLATPEAVITSNKALKIYGEVFDRGGQTFLAARNHRFLVYYSKKNKMWLSKVCGPYVGAGSGGMIAAGLLMGKMPMKKMFAHLHHIDHLSSAEYTAIPLSSLIIMKMKPILNKEALEK